MVCCQRVRLLSAQIDCVMVKGSNQPMGLFTYDVTLEHIASPSDSDAASAAASSVDLQTFSNSSYQREFEEHPDLIK